MIYTDRFLYALGAWQNGWREDATRRLAITAELEAAVAALPEKLPITSPAPRCYRKRFLVPNNPQNGGDLVPLVLGGAIVEGIASWSEDPGFHRQFKVIARQGQITALFAHDPLPHEIVVDVVALWKDPEFVQRVEHYLSAENEHGRALLNFGAKQSEIILNAPLLADEVAGFVGRVGDYDSLFATAGADTEGQQDELFKLLCNARLFPEEARWIGYDSAQRSLAKARQQGIIKLFSALGAELGL